MDYELIKQDLIKADDEVILLGYLKMMIEYGDSYPENILEDVDLYNKNPREVFDYSQNPIFATLKTRTKDCGKTDGCETGCWRIIGRDKLVKSKELGNSLGFKKILKFCENKKPREYKRSWVMEEYRLKPKWNPKQDHVICKIRLMFRTEISSLLSKHFSSLRAYDLQLLVMLPDYADYYYAYGYDHMKMLMETDGNYWPGYVTNNVYSVHPLKLVDPEDHKFAEYGTCFYVNRTEICGKTDDGCDSGCWRIVERDKLIKSDTGRILCVMRVYRFCDNKYGEEGDGEVMVTWTMEEYRLAKGIKQNKVICVIKTE
ncbi:unnamed protein product [Cochlearia groenlandica]